MRWLPALLSLAVLGCGRVDDSQVTSFGALIPLTGALADSGPHIEQALLLAAEQINRAGGLAGKPLRIRVQDTFSDPTRGLEAARKLLENDHLLGLLGPEEDDIARNLLTTLTKKGITEISGGAISTTFSVVDDGDWFFRTNPSAQVTGSALARRMLDDGHRRIGVIFVSNEYGRSLSGVITNAFTGGEVVSPGFGFQGPLSVRPGEESYRAVLASLFAKAPTAIALVVPAQTGAALVRDWSLLGSPARLYLAPSLRSDSFLQSVPPGSVEGAVGVSPALGDSAQAFAAAFAKAWNGTVPKHEAYFYYDALALMALATESAYAEVGGPPSRAQVQQHIRRVSSPPGEPVQWNTLEQGLRAVRAGEDIDYQGVSGTVDFNAVGDVPGSAEFWTIHEDRITADEKL